MEKVFLPGSVGDTLTQMVGVWHDHINVYSLAGEPLSEDAMSGTRGDAPFDNLVYIDFDGMHYRQTNVTFRGRPMHYRSFTGKLQDGILRFGTLGPKDPAHIGISGGPSRIIFCGQKITQAWQNYAEPDFIHLPHPGVRYRTTLLYRNGQAVRSLVACGTKVSPDPTRRFYMDPRGQDGPVHEALKETYVFSESDTEKE